MASAMDSSLLPPVTGEWSPAGTLRPPVHERVKVYQPALLADALNDTLRREIDTVRVAPAQEHRGRARPRMPGAAPLRLPRALHALLRPQVEEAEEQAQGSQQQPSG